MHRRFAFTLLELLLTLAVLAVVFAVAIPQTATLLGDRRLLRGASQVQIEMIQLRVDAMRGGRVMMLEGQLMGNSFRVRPFTSLADATEALDATDSQSALLSGADQGSMTVIATPDDAEEIIELPEDVIIESVSVVSAARGSEIEQQTQGDQAEGWSRPILFYADGTTSTAQVLLSHPEVGKMVVKLRGLTGDATLGEVEAMP